MGFPAADTPVCGPSVQVYAAEVAVGLVGAGLERRDEAEHVAVERDEVDDRAVELVAHHASAPLLLPVLERLHRAFRAPLDGITVTRRFQALLRGAGLPRQRFHDLRHTGATMTATPLKYRRVLLKLSGESMMGDREYGVDPKTVSAIAGDHPALEPKRRTQPLRCARQLPRARSREPSLRSLSRSRRFLFP